METNEADNVGVYATSIYDVLEERHGRQPGSARGLRNYLPRLRTSATISRRATKPVGRPEEDSNLGDQCQVDFSQTRIAGGMVAYILVALLAASRARQLSSWNMYRTRTASLPRNWPANCESRSVFPNSRTDQPSCGCGSR